MFSALPEHAPGSAYDDRARLYDAIVGSTLYNRLLWGASTHRYRKFARQALAGATGPFLDSGSGSAVFTAAAYAASARPLVLVDRSTGMLRAAEQRISAATDNPPSDRIELVQADLFDLPFRKGAFSTVLSMGMLHLFENAGALVNKLLAAVAPGGQLYLTSLVTDRAVGRTYLSLLHRAGEVASPRSFSETRTAVDAASKGNDVETSLEGNMAYFVVAKRTATGA